MKSLPSTINCEVVSVHKYREKEKKNYTDFRLLLLNYIRRPIKEYIHTIYLRPFNGELQNLFEKKPFNNTPPVIRHKKPRIFIILHRLVIT